MKIGADTAVPRTAGPRRAAAEAGSLRARHQSRSAQRDALSPHALQAVRAGGIALPAVKFRKLQVRAFGSATRFAASAADGRLVRAAGNGVIDDAELARVALIALAADELAMVDL